MTLSMCAVLKFPNAYSQCFMEILILWLKIVKINLLSYSLYTFLFQYSVSDSWFIHSCLKPLCEFQELFLHLPTSSLFFVFFSSFPCYHWKTSNTTTKQAWNACNTILISIDYIHGLVSWQIYSRFAILSSCLSWLFYNSAVLIPYFLHKQKYD